MHQSAASLFFPQLLRQLLISSQAADLPDGTILQIPTCMKFTFIYFFMCISQAHAVLERLPFLGTSTSSFNL